jgi:DNA-binding XRE family transcriptional regulator
MLMHRIERMFEEQQATAEGQSLKDLFATARMRKGYRQEDVALAIDAAKSSYILFENQSRDMFPISLEKVLLAAEFLEIDPYLVCYKLGVIHPDMKDAILANWTIYDGVRTALGLTSQT